MDCGVDCVSWSVSCRGLRWGPLFLHNVESGYRCGHLRGVHVRRWPVTRRFYPRQHQTRQQRLRGHPDRYCGDGAGVWKRHNLTSAQGRNSHLHICMFLYLKHAIVVSNWPKTRTVVRDIWHTSTGESTSMYACRWCSLCADNIVRRPCLHHTSREYSTGTARSMLGIAVCVRVPFLYSNKRELFQKIEWFKSLLCFLTAQSNSRCFRWHCYHWNIVKT